MLDHNINIRVTEAQHNRFLKAINAAERLRGYIDTWDMRENPEELRIEAEQKRNEAQALLAEAERLLEKYKIVTDKGSDDEYEVILREYEKDKIYEYALEHQVGWLTGPKWNMSPIEARQFLSTINPERMDEYGGG